MYCVKCNSKIEYDMKKCKKCGRKTAFEDFLFMDEKINPSYVKSEATESEEQVPENNPRPEEKKKSGKGIYIIIACVLAVILAAGAFIFLRPRLTKPNQPETASKPTVGEENKTEENEERKYVVKGLGDDIVVTDEESARNVMNNISGLFGWKESDSEKVEITENTYGNNKFYRCTNDDSVVIIAADENGRVFYIADGKTGNDKDGENVGIIQEITGLDEESDIYKAYDIILNDAEHEVKSELLDLSENINESDIDKDKIQNVWEMSLYMISSDFKEEQCMQAILTASEIILGEQYKDVESCIMKMKADMPEECMIVNEECDFIWLSKSQNPLDEENYIITKTDSKGDETEKLSNNEFYTVKIADKSENGDKEIYVYVSDVGISKATIKTDYDDEAEETHSLPETTPDSTEKPEADEKNEVTTRKELPSGNIGV